MSAELRLPALEVKQGRGHKLYCFAVDGKLVPRFATISRVNRQDGDLHGYQRPEALAHIEGIRDYIESASPMIPNAVVLAFDTSVRFEATPGSAASAYSRPGTLVIPLGDKARSDERKPGFIVDGQQRLAAIREATLRSFPVCVTAFITSDVRRQTEQFILVNSTKPLPKGLIHELLPRTNAQLPGPLHRRRLPALLLERLNMDADSPLRELIQTATNPTGRIKDNSILRMLEHSLSDGALYKFKTPGTQEVDLEAILELLNNYWRAVSTVFRTAWGLPPRKSRLMHGAGIVSMGYIMDTISDRLEDMSIPTTAQYEAELSSLKDICCWTTGRWDFGDGQQRKWNELQNTSKDIDLLADYLIAQYKSRVSRPVMKVARSAHR